jgi:predicted ArsR family transcriptional regulator
MSKLVLSKYADIEVFVDPFHSKIMRVMKKQREPMTVKEIADAMGEVPAKIHYHVKKLEAIGVLYIKYTKQVNGITAKFYDFTTDTVALSVNDKDDHADMLRSLMMNEYGHYFDEAKQKYFDLLSVVDDNNEQNNDVYISSNDSILVAPDQLEEFYEELKTVINKYKYAGEDALNYSLFFSLVKNIDHKP